MSPRHLLVLLAVGVVGLLFDGHALAGWADALPDGAAPVRRAAHAWEDATERLGLAAPYDVVHRWIATVIARPF